MDINTVIITVEKMQQDLRYFSLKFLFKFEIENYSNIKFFIFQLICILTKINFWTGQNFLMRFSVLYSGEQILSFKPCLLFYARNSLRLVSS